MSATVATLGFSGYSRNSRISREHNTPHVLPAESFRPASRRHTHPSLRLYDDGFLVLLRHQHAGRERRLDHVDDQVVGQDVQLLHLVAGHVGAAVDAVTDGTQKKKQE